MLERDYDIIKQSLETIGSRHSFEPMEQDPYKNIAQVQKKCKHMWANDTDAIYFGPRGKRKCAICGKEF